MTRPAPSGRLNRRLMISSVISAATLTPMSTISQLNSVSPRPVSSLSSRALARCPVRKISRSATGLEFCSPLPHRRLQIGERLHDLGALKTLEPFGVLQIDRARINFYKTVRGHGLEFRR